MSCNGIKTGISLYMVLDKQECHLGLKECKKYTACSNWRSSTGAAGVGCASPKPDPAIRIMACSACGTSYVLEVAHVFNSSCR